MRGQGGDALLVGGRQDLEDQLVDVVLEVIMVDGKERYRVKYDDDGTTVEETLRAPFYELIDKDASPRCLDDLNYADTLALAARLVVECPSAAFVSRFARTRNKFPATLRGLDGDDANLRELQVDAHICLLSRRTESCKATLGREPGADRTLLNFVRAGSCRAAAGRWTSSPTARRATPC